MTDSPPRVSNPRALLSQELAAALDTLFSLANDERTWLPKGKLFTDMALNSTRQILDKARSAGVLSRGEQ
jgi:hypothetical protein